MGNSAAHADLVREWATRSDRAAAIEEGSAFTQDLLDGGGKGLQLTEADLSGLDLSGFDLRGAVLNRASLYGTKLARANLTGASLICPGMERTDFSDATLAGAYMHALAAQICNFRNADLTGLVDATGAIFHGCNLAGAKLASAMVAGSAFYQCDLDGTLLTGTQLQGTVFNESVLDGADFTGAMLSQTVFTKCHMRGTVLRDASGSGLVLQRATCCEGLDLSGASLPLLRMDGMAGGMRADRLNAPGADFHACTLTGSSFRGASLPGSRWLSCALEGADLSGSKLDGASFLTCAMAGVSLERAQAENLHVVESKLPGAKMGRFSGRCATFRDCDLGGADLRDAYLYRAMLTGDPPRAMSMRGCDLRGAVLVQAYLTADLGDANLRGAHCAYARFNQSMMAGADLSGVNAYEASMVKTDLTNALLRGLKPPVFIDRCPGLTQAVASNGASGDGNGTAALKDFSLELDRLIRATAAHST